MKKRINLVVALMALCTASLLGLQLYWNFQAYKNSVKAFKSETNDALDKAIERLTNIRRDEFSAEYKKWLSDTSLIVITCKYDTGMKITIFSIADRHPLTKRIPFSLGLDYYKGKTDKITPAAKAFFIDHFLKSAIQNDLKGAMSYFYTEQLGERLVAIYKKDKLNLSQLTAIYKDELLKRDISTHFRFRVGNYSFKKFSERNEPVRNYSFATRAYNYGFQVPYKAIVAWFPDPNLVFLQRMKWVLLGSLILIGITIFCFTYTARIIFKQKKLAELKNDFVNNMTHELKTPVATINIAAEAMQDFDLTNESTDEYLGIIRHQAANLTRLIDDILKDMVLETESIALRRSEVKIDELIKLLINDYKPQLEAQGAVVKYKPEKEDLILMADASLLKNAVANLLDNAIKYGGVSTRITISSNIENGHFNLKISNNGPGIPVQYQDKVFDRFFRVPSGDIHNIKGYGLGLSYVKSIIERHNGTISFTSRENAGTEFIITIPLNYHEKSQGIVA